MKKIKLMSLLTALLLVLGFTASHAQLTGPPVLNSYTRPNCIASYNGCVSNTVTIKFSNTPTGSGSFHTTQTSNSNTTINVNSTLNYAAVSTDGVNFTPYQAIPNSLSDPTIVFTTNPSNPFLTFITFTATNNYTIGVSQNAL